MLVAGALLATSCKEAKKEATDLKNATVETTKAAAEGAKDAAGHAVDGAKDAAGNVINGAKDAAGHVVEGAKDAAGNVNNGAKDVAGHAVEGAKDAAGNVVNGAKDAAKHMTDKASDMANSALSGVNIPVLSNRAVTENLTAYAANAKELIAAKGNVIKTTKLAKKGAELLDEGKKLSSKLKPAELTKYKSALSAIQSKIAGATK